MENPVPSPFGEDDDDPVDPLDNTVPDGFAFALNRDHFTRFTRRGSALLVGFEVEHGGLPIARHRPQSDALSDAMGWSTLTLVSSGDTFFRAPEVIAFFDALVAGILLDGFADTLFIGQGSGAHAALSFALCAPGARILALAPALHPAERYPVTRETLSVARAVTVIFDPADTGARAVIDTVGTPPVNALSCRDMGRDIRAGLSGLDLLDDTIRQAMDGRLKPENFHRELRLRRGDPA